MMLSATSTALLRNLRPLSRARGAALVQKSNNATFSDIICRSMSDKASSTTSAVSEIHFSAAASVVVLFTNFSSFVLFLLVCSIPPIPLSARLLK